jgi:hypothetical protein
LLFPSSFSVGCRRLAPFRFEASGGGGGDKRAIGESARARARSGVLFFTDLLFVLDLDHL